MLQEGWINLNGLKIRYLESGKRNDRHILFIHGLGSSADRWANLPDALSANFHTISLDLPGFGKSDKPVKMDYTIENFRNTVADFINELAINDGKTSIVGHSLGGYIAAEVTMKNKNQIEKLVLVDSSGMLKKPTPLLEEYLQVAINPTPDKVRKVFEQMVADPTRVPSKLVESFIARINLPHAKYAFESTLENSANTQIGLERLKLIDDIPTLIIWGIEDRVIPPEHSEIFKEFIQKSHVEIIQDAGHAPFAEKPEQVCRMLLDFLT
ncbi:MAG: alpha/beta hydrolase [Nitrosopumilus sp.]|nr:alpha/beta hydrolase [Nitrosopumilus sp.]MDH3735583.1 alpha/beta hydrolase [Nitrosopumilus sp.]MDH3822482.1 alpha/beta hydrolase [Nitrosopumilus sp.]